MTCSSVWRPPATTWLSVYGYLLEQGFEVKVINPIQSEAFRKMYIRQTKNDRKDSFMIAQIMRFGQFSATNLSEEVIVAMRQLSRYRAGAGGCLRGTASAGSCALLDQVFPEYDTLFSDTFGVTLQGSPLPIPHPRGPAVCFHQKTLRSFRKGPVMAGLEKRKRSS